MNKKIEGNFQSKFIDWVNCNGGYARNTHGNVYQSGIPDVLMTNAKGVTFCVELKVWRRKTVPEYPSEFLVLCRREQKRFIEKVWEIGGFCPIIAVTESGAACFYTDGKNVQAFIPQILVRFLLQLSHGDFE